MFLTEFLIADPIIRIESFVCFDFVGCDAFLGERLQGGTGCWDWTRMSSMLDLFSVSVFYLD